MKKLGIGLGLIAAGLFLFYLYLGGFSDLEVSEKKAGPFYFVYQKYKGPYGPEMGPVFEKAKATMQATEGSIAMAGIFFDHPEKVEESKLRAWLGFLVSEAAFNRLNRPDYQKVKLEPKDYLYTSFPYKNMISYMIAPGKAYAALNGYVKEKKYPEYQYKETGYENAYSLEIYGEEVIEYHLVRP